VPRRIADDEDMPRRRRGAKAVAVEAEAERGLVLRILLHSPKDTVAGVLAFAAIAAIVANALFLQAGPHPSPMFGSIVTMPVPAQAPASPLPRPRPAEATKSEAAPPEPKVPEPRVVELKAAEPKAADPKTADPKSADPLTNLVKATSAAPQATSSIPRPPAAIPVSSRSDSMLGPGGSRRVAAVQRALTEYGYGQLKPTGTVGSDTQAAIVKFERERKIPATGQMNERLVRELSAMIGRSID
jgi:Putative peptidoglycan binding domain